MTAKEKWDFRLPVDPVSPRVAELRADARATIESAQRQADEAIAALVARYSDLPNDVVLREVGDAVDALRPFSEHTHRFTPVTPWLDRCECGDVRTHRKSS